MLKRFVNGCMQVVNRWLLDPFLFVIILTIVVFIAAMIGTQQGPLELVWSRGGQGEVRDGFWGLLSFTMQTALALVLGSVVAFAKACEKALTAIATLAYDKGSAVPITTSVSTICCWFNWGFDPIVGALLAKVVVRRVWDVNYPLLIVSTYSGFVIWHADLLGSIPLQIDGTGSKVLGIVYQAPATATIFHPMDLVMVLVILVFMSLVGYTMHPDTDHTIAVDLALLVDETEKTYTIDTPAERIEHNKVLRFITLVLDFAYTVYYFVQKGFNLDLNIVNMTFLFLGILLYGDLRRYVDAIAGTASGAVGIPLRLPSYAGIMGLMAAQDDARASLTGIIANFLTQISGNVTFLVLTLSSAGTINFFVPSGGGQQTVQAPIVMPVVTGMGVEYGRTATATAWSDQWTNVTQPFWTLPTLGIAGLFARNVTGYLVIIMIFTSLVACDGLLLWGFLLQVLDFM